MKLKLTVGNETYDVEIDDLQARPIRARIGAEVFEVWPEAPAEPTLMPAAPSVVTASAPRTAPVSLAEKSNLVLSPLPGVMVAVEVQPGDMVAVGQPLCVLEAMKMRNTIRAARAGRILAVRAPVGQPVRHQQVLLEFAPD
jgi:biotin carboxyl carrier protein